MQTPRLNGLPVDTGLFFKVLNTCLKAGDFDFFAPDLRGLRLSWLIVGTPILSVNVVSRNKIERPAPIHKINLQLAIIKPQAIPRD
ncbi:MAG: hypothetical protein QG620_469 [Patescibacteria group bacterium]|nr:hypothetical protein [Patescibacteria group bacterium]